MSGDDFDDQANSAPYLLGERDQDLLEAARALLAKVARASSLRPAELVSVAKLQHVISRLPKVTYELEVSVQVSAPRRRFSEIETFHYWEVATMGGILRLMSGGSFYRPSTGGDSFTSMIWEVQAGERPEF